MKLIKGDIWKFHDAGEWICVTTNGFIKANGRAVMGRGTALQCVQRYKGASLLLGIAIRSHGNVTNIFMEHEKIIAFPVKHNWWEKADPKLIRDSAERLAVMFFVDPPDKVYLPWPGCGNGGLRWKHVNGIISPILDDRFIVVEYDPETV